MKIYNYHPDFKYFTNEELAEPSPLEPGVWLIPAYSTVIKPPDCEDGFISIFNEEYWEIIKDYRGIYYDTSSKNVIENYNPNNPPQNSTKTPPPQCSLGEVVVWENNEWVIKSDAPPPIPNTSSITDSEGNSVVLTPEEKLAQSGLTVEELKGLLGL